MKIKKISIEDINPAPYNPRIDLKPGDPAYEKLKRSIKEFGYIDPIVWNFRTGNLVGGHLRMRVLAEQDVKEVEVSVVNLSLEKEKALNIALNKISGDWDDVKLATLLDELEQLPDFDIGLTGFDPPEISSLFDRYLSVNGEDDFDVEKEAEKITEPVTCRGDIIELGKHRILCGDSVDLEDLKKLFQGKKADLVVCDPPYNVAYNDQQRPTGVKKKRKWDPIESDAMGQEEYEAWLKAVLSNLGKFIGQGAPIYLWNGYRQFGPMHLMLNDLGFHVSCVIIWKKERFALSYSDYNQQSEFCLYGWKKGNGAHNWYGPTNETTVWEVSRDNINTLVHPTQKPVALSQRAIKNSSKKDDIVLDLFLGSGSTLIGAESMGRRCFGVEIDPKYCDVIIRRYIAYVGRENVAEKLVHKYLKEEIHVGK